MLLARLRDQAALNPGPRFYTDQRCHWQLDIDSTTGIGTLLPLASSSDERVTHTLPSIVRSSQNSLPLLCAGSPEYVLGVGASARASLRHTDFIDLHARWAHTHPEDETARTAAAYLSSGRQDLTLPDSMNDSDTVIVSVDGEPISTAPSAAAFWRDEVARLKGLGTDGLCLVCAQHRPLAESFPTMVRGYLVPNAQKNGAALVTVNKPSVGYQSSLGLRHTPICLDCCDDVVRGLTRVLSSRHARTGLGKDARSTWWTTHDGIETGVGWIDEPPTPGDIAAFVDAVLTGPPIDAPDDAAFCTLTVGGNAARIVVFDWLEMSIGDIRRNIAEWWRDHETTTPGGRSYFSVYRFSLACGRWNKQTGQYETPAPGKKNDPHRPASLDRDLRQAAYRRIPLPASLRGHLLHRIHTDQHVDAPRAALLRLIHNRTRKDDPVPPGLDDTRTDNAYLAGRMFALLDGIQYSANSNRASTAERTARINTTYADKHFAGAMTSPRAAISAGQKDLQAWLKLLRRDAPGLAIYFEREIMTIYRLLDPEDDFPAVADINQQSQFVIGYWHQRAHRAKKPPNSDENPATEPSAEPLDPIDDADILRELDLLT